MGTDGTQGMVGVKFVSRAGVFYRLMPEADYPNQRVALFRDTDNLRVQVLDTYFSLLTTVKPAGQPTAGNEGWIG